MDEAHEQRMTQIETALESVDIWFDPQTGLYQRMEGAERAESVDFSRRHISRLIHVAMDDLRRYEQMLRRKAGRVA
jgi:hypothetical protein